LESSISTNERDKVKRLKAEIARLVEEKKKLQEVNAGSAQLKAENQRLVEEKNRRA
jgi:hypothetical protein